MFKLNLICIFLNKTLLRLTGVVTVHGCPGTEWFTAIKVKTEEQTFQFLLTNGDFQIQHCWK